MNHSTSVLEYTERISSWPTWWSVCNGSLSLVRPFVLLPLFNLLSVPSRKTLALLVELACAHLPRSSFGRTMQPV